jgi:hypothetical protein
MINADKILVGDKPHRLWAEWNIWKPSWVTVLHLEHIFILFCIGSVVPGLTILSEWFQAGFPYEDTLLTDRTVMVGRELAQSCLVELCYNIMKVTKYFMSL